MASESSLVALRTVLAINGGVFLFRSLTNLRRPASFFLRSDAPSYAVDAVHVMGITQAALATAQLGVASSDDRRAVTATAIGSALFGTGVAAKALMTDGSHDVRFHRLRLAAGLENLAVATIYLVLLRRSRR